MQALLGLVELQREQGPGLGEGGWDLSWWIGVVLFEGWEGWWDGTAAAAPSTSRRLRAFLEPAWGHRLPSSDLVQATSTSPTCWPRIVEIAGDQGLRCVVAYGAVARLGLATRRNKADALATWRHVIEALLDGIAREAPQQRAGHLASRPGDPGNDVN